MIVHVARTLLTPVWYGCARKVYPDPLECREITHRCMQVILGVPLSPTNAWERGYQWWQAHSQALTAGFFTSTQTRQRSFVHFLIGLSVNIEGLSMNIEGSEYKNYSV